MMSAPPRKKDARTELRTFHSHHPVAGEVLLWESWLRHEVRKNGSKAKEYRLVSIISCRTNQRPLFNCFRDFTTLALVKKPTQ